MNKYLITIGFIALLLLFTTGSKSKSNNNDIYRILSHREKIAKTIIDRENYLYKYVSRLEQQLSASNLRISHLENEGIIKKVIHEVKPGKG